MRQKDRKPVEKGNRKLTQRKRPAGRKKKRILLIGFGAGILILVVGVFLLFRFVIPQIGSNGEILFSELPGFLGKETVKQLDRWNYISNHMEIRITEETRNAGKQKVTMYVADVKVKNMSAIKTAFAKGKFGRNITDKTSSIAKEHQALFAVNGDYYGYRDSGLIIRNGVLYRDMGRYDLLAVLADGTLEVYEENEVTVSELEKKNILHTFSFGPTLVENGVARTSFSNNYHGILKKNPRTGIGMIEPKHFIFIVVDGRAGGYSEGLTMGDFAQEFVKKKCKVAYNLDGGSSSTMYFNGRVVNRPLGKYNERNISDIIYIPMPEVLQNASSGNPGK